MAIYRNLNLSVKKTVDYSSEIIIGQDLRAQIVDDALKLHKGKKIALVTDYNVYSHYSKKLLEDATEAGLEVVLCAQGVGETSKRLSVAEGIINRMASEGLGRDSVLWAVGGGVITDLGGLIAGLFMRGIPYWNVATSFLAQSDAAIGGKTAVDTEVAKNLAGLFNPPQRIYSDTAALRTVPKSDYVCGWAETTKQAVWHSAKFFEFLKDHVDEFSDKDPKLLLEIAYRNAQIKSSVVAQDPFEKTGIRMTLNGGHTVAHALEKHRKYTDLTHGEAVAMGCIVEEELAIEATGFPRDHQEQHLLLNELVGLPTNIPKHYDLKEVLENMKTDKKSVGGKVRFALPKQIGESAQIDGQWAVHIPADKVLAAMQKWQEKS